MKLSTRFTRKIPDRDNKKKCKRPKQAQFMSRNQLVRNISEQLFYANPREKICLQNIMVLLPFIMFYEVNFLLFTCTQCKVLVHQDFGQLNISGQDGASCLLPWLLSWHFEKCIKQFWEIRTLLFLHRWYDQSTLVIFSLFCNYCTLTSTLWPREPLFYIYVSRWKQCQNFT